jgi:hypothetical protein
VLAIPATVGPTSATRHERYHEPRSRKLSAAQYDAIRIAADGRSLRRLAAQFGVSHETIRQVLHDPAALREPKPAGVA